MKRFLPLAKSLILSLTALAALSTFSGMEAIAHGKTKAVKSAGAAHYETKKAKVFTPKTKRHDHHYKWNKQDVRKSRINHQHGRYLPHTHRFGENFIHISPKAKRWPTPKPQAALNEVLPLPARISGSFEDLKLPSIEVAIVVREKSNGVTIVRNVKEIRDSGTPVPGDKLIGVTEFPRPVYFLTDEELEYCERRLRTIGEDKGKTIKLGNAVYCE